MKYQIMVDHVAEFSISASNDLPGLYPSRNIAEDVAARYSKGDPKAKVKYIVREVEEQLPVPTDLESQLHKILGELIAAKEERNALKEKLKSAQWMAERAYNEINILRLRATNVHNNSIFGNWFAKDIKNNWLLADTQEQLNTFANEDI